VRDEGRVVATLVRTIGDLGVAEDAVSEAAVAALRRWPADGVPHRPRAWLTTVARSAALDILRREARPTTRRRRPWTSPHSPHRTRRTAALSLRTLCGLSTADVARLLLVPETTAAKRLTRARRKIADAHIPYRVPSDDELPARLDAVATTVHLLFTAGHAGRDTLVRPQLCDEAIRLARQLAAGRFELQAAIAACHATAATSEDTDRHDVVLLYDALLAVEAATAYREALACEPSPEEAAFLGERLSAVGG
jgi:predicted RNA polymerase sigma factor